MRVSCRRYARVRGQEDRAIQQSGVFYTVGKAGKATGATRAKAVCRKLHRAIPHGKHCGSRQGIHILLALAEARRFLAVGEDEVILLRRPIVFVVAKGEPGLLFDAEHGGKLDR